MKNERQRSSRKLALDGENVRQLAPWAIRPRQLAPDLQTQQWIKERRIIILYDV